MSKVTFQYEIWDNKGDTLYSCWKDIDMSFPPTSGLVFSDGDFTWKSNRSIIYNFEDDSYFVRTVNDSPIDPLENYATMFEELGWEVRS